MNYIQTEIDGVWLIEPKVFNDARGTRKLCRCLLSP